MPIGQKRSVHHFSMAIVISRFRHWFQFCIPRQAVNQQFWYDGFGSTCCSMRGLGRSYTNRAGPHVIKRFQVDVCGLRSFAVVSCPMASQRWLEGLSSGSYCPRLYLKTPCTATHEGESHSRM